MMIGGISSGTRSGARSRAGRAERVEPAAASTGQNDVPGKGRALVALAPRRGDDRASHRPQAAFLAQLLAHRLDLPQTREKRRAPASAAASYRPQRQPMPPAGWRLDISS